MLGSARAIAAAAVRSAEDGGDMPKTADRPDSDAGNGEDDGDDMEDPSAERAFLPPSEPRMVDSPPRDATMPAVPVRPVRGRVSATGRDVGGVGQP